MDNYSIMSAFAALLLVCSIIIIFMALIKRYDLTRFINKPLANRSIQIDEIQYIDQSRKIVLVSHKEKKYLLLLGNKELLLDAYIKEK